ncbi:hypothetical protein chiPu_0008853 [Chiloscyllium punctatum]|uniref:Uncharacterized protein n=1 Tax=Chiloscyllium punctatum TaxID=137246 RepID=A0A401SJ29_CHIPU|nr:hypothetical protein [Chiloscyllium punctatum]
MWVLVIGHFMGKKDYSGFPNSDFVANKFDSDLMRDIQRLKNRALLQDLIRYLPSLVKHETRDNYKEQATVNKNSIRLPVILQQFSRRRQRAG